MTEILTPLLPHEKITHQNWIEFHDGDESSQVMNFPLQIFLVIEAGEIKQLGPLIDFSPEPTRRVVKYVHIQFPLIGKKSKNVFRFFES